MNELQAAMGLENLKIYRAEQEKRAIVKAFYDEHISQIKGIRLPQMPVGVTNAYQYYPIIIEDDYKLTRNELYDKFKEKNILTRKYFFPACHDYDCYKNTLNGRLTDLSVVDENKNILDSPKEYIIGSEEEMKAYIRGTFLAKGSINDPKTSRYHL